MGTWPAENVKESEAKRGLRRQLDARASHDVSGHLERIQAPTLVIGGRYDGMAPVENMQNLAERIPDAELVLCDGGHAFLLQDPQAWATIVEFLRAGKVR